MMMKKIIILLAVLACGVGEVKAENYTVFFQENTYWYKLCDLVDTDGDGIYSAIVDLSVANKLNWNTCNIQLSKESELGEEWKNALWANLESNQSIFSAESFTLGEHVKDGKLSIPIKDATPATYAVKIEFNPSTNVVKGSRMIEFASSNDDWHDSNPVYMEETAHNSGVFVSALELPSGTEFKFITNNNGSLTWYGKKSSEYIDVDNNNMQVSADGVYTITANFSTYAYIEPALVNVSASVGTSGYATFSSQYALDFTGISEVKAYTAEYDKGRIKLTQAGGKVPANTGLVLAGATTDIPTTICTTLSAENLMKPGTGDVVASEGTTYRYALAKNTKTSEIYFAKLAEGSTNTVAIGKAYLEVTSGAAPSFEIFFDDAAGGTTAIDAVKSAEPAVTDGAYYNLAGQRVANPTKGLYIVNGRKVVVK